MMDIIGLTGGIGAGKTTIAMMFKKLGVPVYFSDLEAKNIINTDQEVIQKIKTVFGDEIYEKGILHRKKMAAIVFEDKNKLKVLNEIVHPAVGKHFKRWCKQKELENIPYVLKEAAIIYEMGAEKKFHQIISVSADDTTRIERVIQRDSVAKEEVLLRMHQQLPQKKKNELADFVIDNSKQKMVLAQILVIHQQIVRDVD